MYAAPTRRAVTQHIQILAPNIQYTYIIVGQVVVLNAPTRICETMPFASAGLSTHFAISPTSHMHGLHQFSIQAKRAGFLMTINVLILCFGLYVSYLFTWQPGECINMTPLGESCNRGLQLHFERFFTAKCLNGYASGATGTMSDMDLVQCVTEGFISFSVLWKLGEFSKIAILK